MSTQSLRYGDIDSQSADLHLPVEGSRWPVVCLVHGGFWRTPHGREQFDAVAVDLTRRGYAVWNIGYRRIGEPGGGWPGTLEDVASAVDHLCVLARQHPRLDLARVAVVGHSAGGHLALCVAEQGGRRFSSRHVVPAGVCGLAAVTDLHAAFEAGLGKGAANAFAGGTPDAHPERYALASPRQLLPLGVRQLILHGSEDDAVPIAMSRDYAQAARGAGDPVDTIELPGAGHMEYLDPTSAAHGHLCDWLAALPGRERDTTVW